MSLSNETLHSQLKQVTAELHEHVERVLNLQERLSDKPSYAQFSANCSSFTSASKTPSSKLTGPTLRSTFPRDKKNRLARKRPRRFGASAIAIE